METLSAVWSREAGAWKADMSIVLKYFFSSGIFTNFEVPGYVPLSEGAWKYSYSVQRGAGTVSEKLHRGGHRINCPNISGRDSLRTALTMTTRDPLASTIDEPVTG